MKAAQLIGKMALRTQKMNGDGSWTSGSGVKILNVTDDHVYIANSYNGAPYALSPEYNDDNWIEFWAPEVQEEKPSTRARALLTEAQQHLAMEAVCVHPGHRNYIGGKFYCVTCGTEVQS